jgi:hypothetical protein
VKLMRDCKEVSRLVSRREDEPLPLADRIELWFHMLWCDGCREFERQTAFLRAAMRRYRE